VRGAVVHDQQRGRVARRVAGAGESHLEGLAIVPARQDDGDRGDAGCRDTARSARDAPALPRRRRPLLRGRIETRRALLDRFENGPELVPREAPYAHGSSSARWTRWSALTSILREPDEILPALHSSFEF